MKYSIEYGLVEEPDHEFNKEFEDIESIRTWIGVMEGLTSWFHVYDENGEEVEP